MRQRLGPDQRHLRQGTAVTAVTQESARAQRTGAVVGRGIGLATGSGQSASNRALRTVRGAFAGQQIGRRTSNRQAFEYTVLIGGTSTVTMITDEAGMRVGDCIAVERGSFNNPPGRGWQTRMNNALLQSIGAAKTRRARQE